MKPEQIFDMTEHISAEYIAEAKPKKLRAMGEIPADANWQETAPEETADSRTGKIMHYITTGFAAAAALALVVGGGLLISRMNKPQIADSGNSAESSTQESRTDSQNDSRSDNSQNDASSVAELTDGYAAGQAAAQADIGAHKAEVALNGTLTATVHKIYAEEGVAVMSPFQEDAFSAHLAAPILAQLETGKTYTFVFEDGRVQVSDRSLLFRDGYFDGALLSALTPEELPVSTVRAPQDGEAGLDGNTVRWSKPCTGDEIYTAQFQKGYEDAYCMWTDKMQLAVLNGEFTAAVTDVMPRYGVSLSEGNAAVMLRLGDFAPDPFYLAINNHEVAETLQAGKTYTFTVRDVYASMAWDTEAAEITASEGIIFTNDGHSLICGAREATAEELAQEEWRVTAKRQYRTEQEQQSLDAKRGSIYGADFLRDDKNLYFQSETLYVPYTGTAHDSLTALKQVDTLPSPYFALTDGEQLFRYEAGKFFRVGENKPFLTIDPKNYISGAYVQQEFPVALAHVTGDWYFLVMDYASDGADGGNYVFWFDIKTGQVLQASDTNLFLSGGQVYAAADGSGAYAACRDAIYFFAMPGEGSNKTYNIPHAPIDPSMTYYFGSCNNWALCNDDLYWYCITDGRIHSIDTATGKESTLTPSEPVLDLYGLNNKLYGISADDPAILLTLDPVSGKASQLIDLKARIDRIASFDSNTITADGKRTLAQSAQFVSIEALWDDLLVAKLDGDMFAVYSLADDSLIIVIGEDKSAPVRPISGKVRRALESAAYELEDYDKNPAYYGQTDLDWTPEGLAAMKALWQRTAAAIGNDTEDVKSVAALACSYMSSNGNLIVAAQQTLEEILGIDATGRDWGYWSTSDYAAQMNTAVIADGTVDAEVAAYIQALAIEGNS